MEKAVWIRKAAALVPQLPTYGATHSVEFDLELARSLIERNDHKRLHRMLNEFWFDLPDNPSIRHAPFFDLCDLCADYPT